VSEADSWSALCVPNAGGFGVAFVLSATSTVKLWLNAGQAERFSAELQTFIDLVGSRS
jgi:hypothetical protein